MCGRFASFRDAQALADQFAVAQIADDVRLLPPSWNVAPTDTARVVVERPERGASEDPEEWTEAPQRSLRLARWGLVPHWAKDPSGGARMINARAETLADRPAFSTALRRSRCLVPVDGFYEWRKPADDGRKQPFYVTAADGSALALAGLFAFWRNPSRADDDPERWLVSITVVTRASRGDLVDLHDREPVMLPAEAWDPWLDPAEQDPRAAADLLTLPAPPVALTAVSTAVNAVVNDGPQLVRPLPGA